MLKQFIAGVTAAAALSSVAVAAPVTFVFENPAADLPVAGNFTVGGMCNGALITAADLCTVDSAMGLDYAKDWATLNAATFAAGVATSLIQDLAPANSGLGALTVGESKNDDQIQASSEESIRFDFGGDVFLTEIDFNAGRDRDCANPGMEGPCGTFNLVIDGVLLPMFTALTAIDNLAFAMVSGAVFEIVAVGPLDGGFTIGSITVTNEVPLPAAGMLLLAGVAGLGFASRRRGRA